MKLTSDTKSQGGYQRDGRKQGHHDEHLDILSSSSMSIVHDINIINDDDDDDEVEEYRTPLLVVTVLNVTN